MWKKSFLHGWGSAANHRVNPTWLIGALFKFLTRIGVSSLAKALTP